MVENLNYADCLKRYDRPHTFFYIDPPYYDCENDYGDGIFTKQDFETLANALATLQGTFLLSINDKPAIRELFKGFNINEVDTVYSTGSSAPKKVTELLIRNY